ncbi:hypothetical protein LPJ66_012331, partial [Kickxella alabastrina]
FTSTRLSAADFLRSRSPLPSSSACASSLPTWLLPSLATGTSCPSFTRPSGLTVRLSR